jgi:hypothetical protein
MQKVAIVFVGILLLLGTLLGGSASPANAQGTLYDDFRNSKLNANKWFGRQFVEGGPGGLELIREIQQGELFLFHRVLGGATANTGRHMSRNQLEFLNPDTITAMRFDVRVVASRLRGCTIAGADRSNTRARMSGFLFNDGSSTAPRDSTGDVSLAIEVLQRSTDTTPPEVLDIQAFLTRCQDFVCSASPVLAIVNLGSTTMGTPVTLQWNWDPTRNRVNVRKNSEPVQRLVYPPTNAVPPVNRSKRLEVRVDAANCQVGARPFAEIGAFFDNVFVTQ